jgi:peptide-methionine (S)-S-oxide reductase
MSSTASRTAFRTAPLLAAALLIGCDAAAEATAPQERAASQQRAAAVFAGGCFWCTEADFDKMPGVLSTTSGYIGGKVRNPTYKQVSAGGTGHIEAVRVVYDPAKTNYATLAARFIRTIDPLDAGGSFCDRGYGYRSAFFVANPEQRRVAQTLNARAAAVLKKPVATLVLPAATFYPAEGYHQDYYKKNPVRYRFYRANCGRDARLAELWGGK